MDHKVSDVQQAPRVFHQNSSNLADFRAPAADGVPIFGQQQQGQAHITNGPPGLNGGHGGMHRRNGTAHTSNGTGLVRDSVLGTKNTSHVPCKFFKEGKCQAGRGCQFSHAVESFHSPVPCKYFAKGNCKYGYRCANPHLMSDGRDARHTSHNRARQPFGGRNQFSIGPPAQQGYSEHTPPIAFAPTRSPQLEPAYRIDELSSSPPIRYDYIPHMDITHNTNGGMGNGMQFSDSRQPISPPMRALDAPMPPTFQSVPPMNTYDGPFPASFPARPSGFAFGPASATTSTATSTAFGNLAYMVRPEASGMAPSRKSAESGSSPPASSEIPFQIRTLHSDRLRQPQHVASSLPMSKGLVGRAADVSSDDDDDFIDFLPADIGDDILTLAERKRRASRNHEDTPYSRQSASAVGSPPDSKFGSPSNASPSGWGILYARKQREETHQVYGSSPHGPVGSPLRNLSLHPDAATRHGGGNEKENSGSPLIRPIARPSPTHLSGDVSPFGMQQSPPDRRAAGGIGMLSQQLKNTRLRDPPQDQHASHLQTPRITSNSSALSNSSAPGSANARLDRVVSATSTSRSDRIDEEAGIFKMDEQDEECHSIEHDRQMGTRTHPWNDTTADLSGESGKSSPGLGMARKSGLGAWNMNTNGNRH